ncbi:FGGY family carbohydrate kinase [Lacticaseibacillus manihotivorans]|uniref:FGGY family carbohydrate kinase n=1 Tax=Lacticaseibacillus manihotivorans TaxID=88233 RepID=UPI000AAF212B|nr:FGGY family carbohydrate kinase [Lacticaseibacillus manihotivorans]
MTTQALSQLQGETLTGVAISNQRETAAAWTRSTGKPLDLAIVWQDNRAIDLVDALCNHPAFKTIKQTTGLALSPYFSAAKWAWLIQHNEAVEKAQQLGDLCSAQWIVGWYSS